MKRLTAFITALIMAFTVKIPVSAALLPDGRVVPDEVGYYLDFLHVDRVARLFTYNIGLTTAKDISEDLRLRLAARLFMNPDDEAWRAEYTSCDSMLCDIFELRGIDTSTVKEVEVYVLPAELVQEKYSMYYGDGVKLSEKSYDRLLVGRYECDYIRTVLNGEDVYLYYVDLFQGGGDYPAYEDIRIYDFEYTDSELLVYVGYYLGYSDLEYVENEDDAVVRLYADTDRTFQFITFPYAEYSEYIDKEYYDSSVYEQKYYAQYLHRFNSDGNGGYYWLSTELIGIGEQPAEEIIPSTSDCSAVYYTLALSSAVVVCMLCVKRKSSHG